MELTPGCGGRLLSLTWKSYVFGASVPCDITKGWFLWTVYCRTRFPKSGARQRSKGFFSVRSVKMKLIWFDGTFKGAMRDFHHCQMYGNKKNAIWSSSGVISNEEEHQITPPLCLLILSPFYPLVYKARPTARGCRWMLAKMMPDIIRNARVAFCYRRTVTLSCFHGDGNCDGPAPDTALCSKYTSGLVVSFPPAWDE